MENQNQNNSSIFKWLNERTPLMTPLCQTSTDDADFLPLLEIGSPVFEPTRKRERDSTQHYQSLSTDFNQNSNENNIPSNRQFMTPLALLDLFSQQHIDSLAGQSQPLICQEPLERLPSNLPYIDYNASQSFTDCNQMKTGLPPLERKSSHKVF